MTNQGDLVVDPFAGSCVTGEVAERMKRRWICVDLVEVYLKGVLLLDSMIHRSLLHLFQIGPLSQHTTKHIIRAVCGEDHAISRLLKMAVKNGQKMAILQEK